MLTPEFSLVVILVSILAAGYLKLLEEINCIASLPNIKGVAVGVLKEKQACETFRLNEKKLELTCSVEFFS
jgi:hypothetical protein